MDYYRVGTLVNTHGIRGEVKVVVITDFPEKRFAKGQKVTLFKDVDATTGGVSMTISKSREQKGLFFLTFKGFDNINDVEKYKGWTIKVAAETLHDLPEGEYYYHEIVGLKVVTTDGETLGKIKEILSPGANDVWVVQRDHGQSDVLLPKIPQVIKNVDIEAGQVTVELMEGLID
ncbi:ribosome maturation factor RimM [Lactiplantibacillus mudanjiangensis]|uniref:Ribosome maturation factor RimM n=1 Tax=Lactiplantibacillus mudanjiangensis TaxID=1296538 RepID=A0A660E6U7_9LACO|nr:ribosome maturation factor RimM [Lactiplantibacillus mudanjiangensis]VDG19781.1 ribosome maturation factor RimM [Lactobacillus sp.] [Lactiplantibacillus mudanjiangensis]VDG23726.1 ribosome maturation factor RimM [Lactobacillus sp.] [Lactiplantibacillus mudanjiangensis]VDG29828.1 ribosome maturation factor RimM [Lactobacillus sp.] [Lactiplantibacillus mudanjiangensis]VDG31208.1 ribosome maturation factor RimM [Lactobacillus sp.] [Lactiplantibacillus mudanjiangensis]